MSKFDKMEKKQPENKGRLLLHLLHGSKIYFAAGILSALLMTLCEMLIPQIIRFTVDSLIGEEEIRLPSVFMNVWEKSGGREYFSEHLGLVALAVLLIAACAGVLRWLSTLENTKGGETLSKNLQDRLNSHIARLPLSWHMEHQTGDMIQRCTSDVRMIKEFCSDQLYNLVHIVLMLLLSLMFMFPMQPMLTVIAMVFVPIIVGYSLIFHVKFSSQFTLVEESEGVLSSVAQENLTGVRVVRAFGAEAAEEEKFRKQNHEYTNIWMRICRFLAMFWMIGDLVSGLQVLTVILIGTILCVRGNMTVGSYLAFLSYNSMLAWPIRSLGRVIADISKSGVSIGRIQEVLSSEPEKEQLYPIISGENICPEDEREGEIEFDHVSFSFGKTKVLSDVSFRVPKGSTVGILGSTGSGKSTLVQLIDRLYELPEDGGSIRFGGKDIRSIPLSELRSSVGMVLQDPFLFSRTIAENIDMTGRKGTESFEKVTEIASLKETLEEFPQGSETMVGERGVTLSGGQKQRIAIARMLMEEKSVLIFDDSLSAIDAETDSRIRKALRENLHGSTVFYVSHRISTLMDADCIYVLQNGEIAESGNHEDLIQKNGIYKRIFDLQFGGAAETVESETGSDSGEMKKEDAITSEGKEEA